jgi:hypothetical protein
MQLFVDIFSAGGWLLQIKRTEGVSTTDIVGRMLTCTRVNHNMARREDNHVSALVLDKMALVTPELPQYAAA